MSCIFFFGVLKSKNWKKMKMKIEIKSCTRILYILSAFFKTIFYHLSIIFVYSFIYQFSSFFMYILQRRATTVTCFARYQRFEVENSFVISWRRSRYLVTMWYELSLNVHAHAHAHAHPHVPPPPPNPQTHTHTHGPGNYLAKRNLTNTPDLDLWRSIMLKVENRPVDMLYDS